MCLPEWGGQKDRFPNLSFCIGSRFKRTGHILCKLRNSSEIHVPDKRNLMLEPTFLHTTVTTLPVVAAIGYSLIYMLFGGGVFGAIVIFVVAKMFGK